MDREHMLVRRYREVIDADEKHASLGKICGTIGRKPHEVLIERALLPQLAVRRFKKKPLRSTRDTRGSKLLLPYLFGLREVDDQRWTHTGLKRNALHGTCAV